jgi:hypothetical protein
MIKSHIDKMIIDVNELIDIIASDIEDVKFAKHESLQSRVDRKNFLVSKLTQDKITLNNLILEAMNRGEDVNIYRVDVDRLEQELLKLQKRNRDFATILMPIKQLYEELINESFNGREIVQVKA